VSRGAKPLDCRGKKEGGGKGKDTLKTRLWRELGDVPHRSHKKETSNAEKKSVTKEKTSSLRKGRDFSPALQPRIEVVKFS